MTDITIEIIKGGNRQSIAPLEEHLLKRNKAYTPERFTKLAVISTNDITIGLVGVTEQNDKFIVDLFQAPAVCRMSVLSLIEASVHLVHELLENNIKQVVYNNVHYTLVFKIQQMIPNCKSVEDLVVLDAAEILNTDLSKVSLKRVHFENL